MAAGAYDIRQPGWSVGLTHHDGVAFLVQEGATLAAASNDDSSNLLPSPSIRAVNGRVQCFNPNFLINTPDIFVLSYLDANCVDRPSSPK